MKTINVRRSIRKFNDKYVPDEAIELILRAAMQAPSGGNQQPWEFLVVRDSNNLEKLSGLSPYAKPVYGSSASIVVCANKDYLRFPELMEMDLGACTQNILLEATNLGVGSVWMSVHPTEDRVEYVKNLLKLPKNVIPFGVVALGYPEKESDFKFVNRYNSERVKYEKY